MILAVLSLISMASAFIMPERFAPKCIESFHLVPVPIFLNRPLEPSWKMAAGDLHSDWSTSSSTKKKRRKRKDGKQFLLSTDDKKRLNDDTLQEKNQMTPKQSTVLTEVRDIRDALSVVDEKSTMESLDDDDDFGEDEEEEYDYNEGDIREIISNKQTVQSQNDSLEQLLSDARRMRASSMNTSSGELTNPSLEKTKSISDTLFEIISTVVTIDFFVVIGLLVWFLIGIFCSSVFKDDTVQIAFNMNFEKVTQPALGILMIGSVAGALGKKEEDE